MPETMKKPRGMKKKHKKLTRKINNKPREKLVPKMRKKKWAVLKDWNKMEIMPNKPLRKRNNKNRETNNRSIMKIKTEKQLPFKKINDFYKFYSNI